MGVAGRMVETFAEGNVAMCDNMSMDSDYPHKFFNVVRAAEGRVTLESHWDGAEFSPEVKTDDEGEYDEIEQKSTYEKLFGLPAARFKIRPMAGRRI
jgi:hypothetical protein